MRKLIKKLTLKQIILVFISIAFVTIQVWLDLKIPDYMNEITKLIQTPGTKIKDILNPGSYMVLCAFGSLILAVLVGYIVAHLSASFSLNVRKKLFNKVQELSLNEVKSFSTSSLITRTTNDITQVEMFIGMGLQMLIKAPITAIWAVTKILNKSVE